MLKIKVELLVTLYIAYLSLITLTEKYQLLATNNRLSCWPEDKDTGALVKHPESMPAFTTLIFEHG